MGVAYKLESISSRTGRTEHTGRAHGLYIPGAFLFHAVHQRYKTHGEGTTPSADLNGSESKFGPSEQREVPPTSTLDFRRCTVVQATALYNIEPNSDLFVC